MLEKSRINTDECLICCEVTNKFTGCSRCYKRWCCKCFIKSVYKNDGVIKCPFCNRETGNRLDESSRNDFVNKLYFKIYGY